MKIYIQLARTERGHKVRASMKPNHDVLSNEQSGAYYKPFPTISFAIDLNIPPDAFRQAERVIETLHLFPDQLTTATQLNPRIANND